MIVNSPKRVKPLHTAFYLFPCKELAPTLDICYMQAFTITSCRLWFKPKIFDEVLLSRDPSFTHTHTHAQLSVGIAAAAGGIGRHGLHVVLVLLVVTRGLQAKVVAVVRRQHPHWDVGGLPGVVRRQDVWENKWRNLLKALVWPLKLLQQQIKTGWNDTNQYDNYMK